MLDYLDLRLSLDTDSYTTKYESINFISKILTEYNNLQKIKDNQIMDLKDSLFYNNFPNIYNFLSVLTLKDWENPRTHQLMTYSDKELIFISNLAYKQKGSIESLKMILDLVKGSYKDISIDSNLTLSAKVSFENVREIYLSSKYLQKLCQDLLFFDDYDITIESMSVRYNLSGNVHKRYAIYTTFDLLSTSIANYSTRTPTVITGKVTEDWEYYNDFVNNKESKQYETTEIDDNNLTTYTRKNVSVSEDLSTYTINQTVISESLNKIDQKIIDTYEW